jgi:hypothetical protein
LRFSFNFNCNALHNILVVAIHFTCPEHCNRSRDTSVGIVMGYGLENRDFIPGRGKKLYLLHRVQTGLGANQAFCPVGTGGIFSADKAARVWRWPLTSM